MQKNDQSLSHYGVPGMKWGVRKALQKSGGFLKRKKAPAKRSTQPAAKKKAVSPFKDPKKMDYEDLKREVDRLEKEKKYLELTGQAKKKGENFVTSALKAAAKTTLQNAATAILSNVLSNVVSSVETKTAAKQDKKQTKQGKKAEQEAFTQDWLARKAAQKKYLDGPSRPLALPAGNTSGSLSRAEAAVRRYVTSGTVSKPTRGGAFVSPTKEKLRGRTYNLSRADAFVAKFLAIGPMK